jgi:hypothetical protein
MALVDDFKARFPNIAAATADQFIPILEPVWTSYWGGDYDTAHGQEIVLNLLAHVLVSETSNSDDSPKTVQSQSVGSVSESFAPGFAPDSDRIAWFNTTKYGARYLLLTGSRRGGVFV